MYHLIFVTLTLISFSLNPILTFSHSFIHQTIKLGDEYDNGYPEERYHKVLDTVEAVYGPIIAAKGGTLTILRDFRDGTVNAFAERWGDNYRLEIPGGSSRYYLFTEEGFITLICHEMGHLLGGAPVKSKVISVEGQSDYYSTTHCAKKIYHELKPYKTYEITTELENICSLEDDKDACYRLLMGAQSLANFLAKLEKVDFPSLSKEDPNVVTRTLSKHPKSQCRLDTMKRGALCHADEEDISFTDPDKGYCYSPENQRPKCWFKP
tara:strand:+ start:548 stop:1345 length:798 start_codon:yes stop_codon:yes gene_type:complete